MLSDKLNPPREDRALYLRLVKCVRRACLPAGPRYAWGSVQTDRHERVFFRCLQVKLVLQTLQSVNDSLFDAGDGCLLFYALRLQAGAQPGAPPGGVLQRRRS